MGGGELFAEVASRNGLDETTARVFFRQLLLGVAYCHSRGLAHRDLKLENFLLDESKKVVKICDFGFAKDQDAAMP